jgi:hypothetical protein
MQAYINNSEIIDPEAEVERIFKECDRNESGFIDYTGKVYFNFINIFIYYNNNRICYGLCQLE